MKKIRSICKSKFTRLKNSLRKNVDERTCSCTIIESRFADLRNTWMELQRKHDDYSFAADDIDDVWIEEIQKEFKDTKISSRYLSSRGS